MGKSTNGKNAGRPATIPKSSPASKENKRATAKKGTTSTDAKRKPAPPPPPPVDYHKLSTILASQKPLGNYPLTVGRLLELADLEWPGDTAFADDVASRYFGTSAVTKKRPTLEQALVFLPDDLGRLTSYPQTLRVLIERETGGRPEGCALKNIAKGCDAGFQSTVREQTRVRLRERMLPAGIGALLKGDKDDAAELFIFDHVIGTRDGGTANVARTVTAAPSAAPPELAERMKAAFDRIDAETGKHNQVLLRALREAVGVPRGEFDACLESLRYAGVFTLAPHEGRFDPLATEDTAAGIPGPSGRLVYAARRTR